LVFQKLHELQWLPAESFFVVGRSELRLNGSFLRRTIRRDLKLPGLLRKLCERNEVAAPGSRTTISVDP
jgi:hypothetical protein